MGKKYKIREDGRIVALRSFGSIKKGDVGGRVGNENNLSHTGLCWVSSNAQVSGNVEVSGNAEVSSNAEVSGNAQVSGSAWVSGNAQVSGDAQVSGNAQVSGDAQVSGNAQVSGDAQVYGSAWVSGSARVAGSAGVFGDAHVIKSPVNIINTCEFNVTQYNNWLQVGCELHTLSDWYYIINSGEKDHLAKNPERVKQVIYFILSLR